MSRKHQIRKLSDLSLNSLASSIVTAVGSAYFNENYETMYQFSEIDMSLVMVQISSYLECCGATNIIYEDLLKTILSSDISPSIRFACLQILLNDTVQTLITENFPYPYYERILQVICQQGKNIRYLSLKGIWIKTDHMCYMYTLIRNLPNLYKLVIPYIANDDLIKHIAMYSKNLHALDISGETDITDLGIDNLCHGINNDLLTVIDIGSLGDENVDHDDVANLILNIPNLVSLVTYSFVGKALRYIVENKFQCFKCKLQYVHDTETKDKTLDCIVRTCPNLKLIYLDTPEPGILHKLSQLQKLQRLKIYKFNCEEIYPVLEDIGENLQHITFIKGKSRYAMDIGRIAKTCPNLQDLDFYMMDSLTYTSGGSFRKLEGLEILNSPLSTNCLKSFICNNSKSLKRLAVDVVNFTDEEMIK
jgi:hypothetical protein